MNYALRLLAFVIIIVALQTTRAENSLNTVITNPDRTFGYTLGDVLEQTISLSIEDTVHTLQSLPVEQRVGRWVTRSAVSISDNEQWLTIRYQIINAPPDVRTVALPELTLITDNNATIEVPTWFFSIAPLLPASTDLNAQLPVLQPDEQAYIPASNSLWRNIVILAITLTIWLSLWLAWWLWRNYREARALPFANAYHAIRHLVRSNDVESNEGWLAIHKAFNQSAGRSIVSGTVNELSSNCTWLEPFKSEIKKFYTLSSMRFFAPESQHEPFDLNDFSKRLYQAEKRYTTSLSASSTPSSRLVSPSSYHPKTANDTDQGVDHNAAQSKTTSRAKSTSQRVS